MSEEPQHVDQSENSSQQEANLHNETIQSYFENDETIPQESSESDTSKEKHEDQDKPFDDSIPLNPNGRKRKQNRKWIPKSVYRRQKRNTLKKKINLVHNFSSIELSEAALSVLNKGLNFCPAQKGVNYTQFLADLFRVERKMAWAHHFKDEEKEETSGEQKRFSFPNKKQKTNLPPEYPKEISDLINSVKS